MTCYSLKKAEETGSCERPFEIYFEAVDSGDADDMLFGYAVSLWQMGYKDYKKAEAWYRKAIENGNEDAKGELENIIGLVGG